MNNQERLKKNITKFLQMFNLYINDEDKKDLLKKLYNGQTVYIYNDCMDVVGQMTFSKDNLQIYSMNKDYIISAVSDRNEDALLNFGYSINDINNYNNCIKGKYYIEKGKKIDGILIKNVIDIYQNGNFVGKCVFDTLRNYIYIYDITNKTIIRYRNNELKYSDKDKEINVVHDRGNIMYGVNYVHKADRNAIFEVNPPQSSDRDVYGNKKISYPLPNHLFYKIEQAIAETMEEFNNNYYERIEFMKNQVNNFNENLFENLATSSLKNFDRKQLDSMLKIDFSKYKGKAKTKK